jgi:hypothetical protein
LDTNPLTDSWSGSVEGWKNHEKNGIKMRGRFVLKKNEATDNGKIQISVLEILPPERCVEGGSFPARARVKLQFLRLTDQKILCSDVFPENGGVTVSSVCGDSLDEFGIFGVGVRAINIKDRWVLFELDGDYEQGKTRMTFIGKPHKIYA